MSVIIMSEKYSFDPQKIILQRDHYLSGLTRFLSSMGITPSLLNILGLMFGVCASLAIARGNSRSALKLIFASTLADVLDVPLARNTNVVSKAGNVFDASCDRAVDIGIYSGFLVRASVDKNYLIMALAWLNLMADTTRSFIRARAESIFCDNSTGLKVGLITRPRKLLFILTGLLHPKLLPVSLLFSGILSVVSIIQRVTAVTQKSNSLIE